MNEYFVPGAVPAPNSPGSSAIIRAEFTSIASAFDKLPVLAGSANEFIVVDPTGTRMIASGFVFAEFVTLNGAQTLTNKTLSWANNTWPGFGSAATKTAGTGAGQVLLLAESTKLPALDASLLTNLTPAALGIVPVVNGGTGANNLGSAQVNLGINLKANAANAVLTGAPTCPTPPVGNNSSRVANTQFVVETVVAVGGAVPSNAPPQMNGVAAAGVRPQVSRDDHVHPVDTSRAPASAATAAGTSFTPTGGVLADNMQAAIVELDTEKAPLASPALTGTPTSTTPSTSDNSTRVATTAFTQSLLAQQPAGVQLSNSAPQVNGTVSPGTGVEASRYDHVHPSDTIKANAANPTTSGTLTHTGNATFSGGRPLNINPATGVAALRGDAGGWVTEFGFQGSAGTAKGGFGALGSGDALTHLYVGDSATPHLRFNDAGVIVSKSVPLGYGPGAWGTTTQPTNKRTNVALHKPSGQITMHPEALAAGASATFRVACSHVSQTDHIVVLSNALVFAVEPAYAVEASTLLTGVFYITVKNISAVSQANALVLNFCVVKGAG